MSTSDLFALEVRSDPHRYYGELRENEPVYWNDLLRTWLVTGYDEVMYVLRNADKFSSQIFAKDSSPPMPAIAAGDAQNFETVKQFFGRTLSVLDPPDHTVIRRALQKAFSLRSVQRYRDMITDEATRHLADAAASGEVTDFVDDVAMPFPITVIARILGIPESEMPKIRLLGSQIHAITRSEPSRMRTSADGIQGFEELLGDLLDLRLRQPTDDLLSVFAELESAGIVTRDDAIANAALLLSAGHETTSNFITNAIVTLSTRPDVWADLRSRDSNYIGAVVEECLRFDGPVVSFLRIPTVDVELGGKTLKAGDRVRWVITSANRDPTHFVDPDEFLPSRGDSSHLSFGNGIHFCLGAHLARMEAEIFLSTMATQYPEYRLAPDQIRYQASVSFRAVESLSVILGQKATKPKAG